MKVYGVEFEITKDCIDEQRVDQIPGEGVIIPLLIDKIDGFSDYIVRNRCVPRKRKIDMIYIFSFAAGGEMLCAKFEDGSVYVIQNIGKVDLCQKYLAQPKRTLAKLLNILILPKIYSKRCNHVSD